MFILILLTILSLVQTKRQSCNEILNRENDFFYCTKFGVGKGQNLKVEYNIRFARDVTGSKKHFVQEGFHNRSHVKVTVGLFMHKNFQKLLKIEKPSCSQRQSYVTYTSEALVPLNGTNFKGEFEDARNRFNTHMYYMGVMDCENEIYNVIGENQYVKFMFHTHLTANDDEFSFDRQGLFKVDLILVSIFMGLLYLVSKDFIRWLKEFETYNSPHIWCLIALSLQFLAVLMSLIFNYTYAKDGIGMVVFDIFSTILDMISECFMTMIILMLANGWMTKFQSYDFDDGLEIYAPLFFLNLMLHVLFGALTYVDQDAHHKYHDFHGWVGYCVIVLKFILVAVFFWFYSYAKSGVGKASQNFYDNICRVGLMYLLSDPFTIMTSFGLDEYNRQYYYRIVDQSIHIFTVSFILYQMSQKGSSYNRSVLELNSLPMMK